MSQEEIYGFIRMSLESLQQDFRGLSNKIDTLGTRTDERMNDLEEQLRGLELQVTNVINTQNTSKQSVQPSVFSNMPTWLPTAWKFAGPVLVMLMFLYMKADNQTKWQVQQMAAKQIGVDISNGASEKVDKKDTSK